MCIRDRYIPLTEDQEKEITGSDEIIDPVMYGIDGITYAASQEDVYKRQGLDTLVVHAVNDEY